MMLELNQLNTLLFWTNDHDSDNKTDLCETESMDKRIFHSSPRLRVPHSDGQRVL